MMRQLAWTTRVAAMTAILVLAAPLASWSQEEAPESAVIAPLAEQALLLDVAAAGDAFVAVGERGHVLISTDAGASWTQVVVPTRSTLTGVSFHDGQLGWAVGHDAVILRTADGGRTWQRVHWSPEDEAPLLDVWFADADAGFAIGAYGSFFVTTDGGATWAFSPISEDDSHLNRMARSDSGRLYIAAERGMVFRSDDDGATWTELPSPYQGSFFGVLPLAGDDVLAFGLRGHLFRSEDAGETWTGIETGTVAMFTDGVRLADGRVVVVGLSGAVLISADGGRSFELRPQDDRLGTAAALETSAGNLLMVGERGVRVVPIAQIGMPQEGSGP